MTTPVWGNELSQRATEAAILRVPRFLVLSGPEHVGKRTFALSFLESLLDEADLMVAETGPDGARAARSFLSDMPSFSPFRAILVDDMDMLSEPAQDSWLKICEETPGTSCVVAVASDPFALLPPLFSRIVDRVRWSPLSDPEVLGFASSLSDSPDEISVRMCRGLPGLYPTVAAGGFVSLFESVCAAIQAPSAESRIPDVVKSLESGKSPARDAVCLVVRQAALSVAASPELRPAAASFLRFAANMQRVPSANAEIHWMAAVISSLKM